MFINLLRRRGKGVYIIFVDSEKGSIFSHTCNPDHSKTPRIRTWIVRTCYAKICQLSPLYNKNLFSLKFETGS